MTRKMYTSYFHIQPFFSISVCHNWAYESSKSKYSIHGTINIEENLNNMPDLSAEIRDIGMSRISLFHSGIFILFQKFQMCFYLVRKGTPNTLTHVQEKKHCAKKPCLD